MQPYNFIIVDDDILTNKICGKIIDNTYPKAALSDFTSARNALEYICATYSKPQHTPVAIVFLDINMPEMDGWEFLELFSTFPEDLKSRVKICMLSSSVDQDDMTRAENNISVEYYLVKPLTKESVKLIVSVINSKYGELNV